MHPHRHPRAVQAAQWSLVLLGPAVVIGILTRGAALVLLPLGATHGVAAGLLSRAPHVTPAFRCTMLIACLICVALFATGYRFRTRLAGKLLCAAGLYLWCITGLIGFGAQ